MEHVTVIISIIGVLLILNLKNAYAFLVYLVVLLYYPSYLVLSIGTIDISASRMCVIVLLLKIYLSSNNIRDNKNLIDKWIICYSLISFIIPVLFWRQSFLSVFIYKCGGMLDTFVAFLVARKCFTSESDFNKLSLLPILLFPLALIGIYEAVTGDMLFQKFVIYCPWRTEAVINPMRFGFHRAEGPISHPILFGSIFAMFFPIMFYFRKRFGVVSVFLTYFSIIGVLSSMSSGPLVMIILALSFCLLHGKHLTIKSFIALIIFGIFTVSIISNRPFYHVIASYANPFGGTGWHRAKLIDLAIEHFNEWWLYGYRGQDPGWGQALGMTWTDITNHYIAISVTSGFFALLAFLGVLISSLLIIKRAYNLPEATEKQKKMLWCFGSIILMLIIAYNSCTLFVQGNTVFWIIVGLTSSYINCLTKQHRIYKGF